MLLRVSCTERSTLAELHSSPIPLLPFSHCCHLLSPTRPDSIADLSPPVSTQQWLLLSLSSAGRKWFTNKKSSRKEYGNSAPDAGTLEEISYRCPLAGSDCGAMVRAKPWEAGRGGKFAGLDYPINGAATDWSSLEMDDQGLRRGRNMKGGDRGLERGRGTGGGGRGRGTGGEASLFASTCLGGQNLDVCDRLITVTDSRTGQLLSQCKQGGQGCRAGHLLSIAGADGASGSTMGEQRARRRGRIDGRTGGVGIDKAVNKVIGRINGDPQGNNEHFCLSVCLSLSVCLRGCRQRQSACTSRM
ncbi:hypothetical protein F7725_012471 [Dissostichus mawsoni]|uniref:Uncharacterized protein n=1 Tax=Dissostichus mawsoni TaxID=36200 RepID=A0A7J5YPM9_DISMA|nr:hypothetical protein F7725_012471 [Dissostichus mawsoni]